MLATRTPFSVVVEVCRTEVLDFMSRWPCSVMPDAAVVFVFDARTHDLLDIQGMDYDGPDLLALCQDAKAFAFGEEA